ncbi:MAG: TonB-dependent receptor [Nitrospinae bacterium]|nr:TonB-dependent receptor [Nitrospinota bacterium]
MQKVLVVGLSIVSLVCCKMASLNRGWDSAAWGQAARPTIAAAQPTLLEPVVVTATRLRDVPEDASRLPAKISVITAEDIQQMGARTVQEALQYQGEVVLYDQIGNPFQQTIDLRGFNAQPVPTTGVFVDGVRVNEGDFGIVNFDLIPIEDVERIEVMPGTTTIFGRNALGGAINILTKRGHERKVEGEVALGSFNRQRFRVSGSVPFKDFDVYVGATRELEDGFRDEAEGRMTRLLAKVGYRPWEATDISLSLTHVNNHLGQAGSLPLDLLRRDREANVTPGDFSDALLHFFTLNVRQKLPLGFSVALNSFYRDNTLEGFTAFTGGTSQATTDIQSFGGTVQATHEGQLLGQRNLFTMGVEVTPNTIETQSEFTFGGFPSAARRETDETALGVYLQNRFDLLPRLTLTTGFRYDRTNLDFRDKIDPTLSGEQTFDRMNPRVGLVYNVLDSLGIYISYAEGFRTPTVDELFALGPFGSNPDIKPMQSRTVEVGFRGGIRPWFDGSLALFHTDVEDEILFVVTDPVTFFGRNENISDSRRRGIELSLKGRYRNIVDGFLNYSFTQATFETDVLLFSGFVREGSRIPLVPRFRFSSGLNFHPGKGWTISLMGLHVSDQVLLNDEPNTLRPLGDYFILNGQVSYQQAGFRAFLTAYNLLNREYETFGVVGGFPAQPFLIPAPKIHFFGGVSYAFR